MKDSQPKQIDGAAFLQHLEDSLAEAEDLQARNQPGVNIVTNEVAYRLLESRPEQSKRAA